MTQKLYKYAGPGAAPLLLPISEGGVFRCSTPSDFNDPYELFLAIDVKESPEFLAFYADVVGELPQLPTTCFSRNPSSLPMWAHYAQNAEGFVLEIDEARLSLEYPESGFGDVDYRPVADPALNEALAHAYHTAKPRHTYLLRKAVFSAAYYTKSEQWAYEQERRMVARETDIRPVGDLLLLDIPAEAISAVICGPRASAETRRYLIGRAVSLGSRFLDVKIARTSIMPYFVDASNRLWRFSKKRLTQIPGRCGKCGEPTEPPETTCSLCAVYQAHRTEAARRNPYRILHTFGMLPDYVREMDMISRRGRD